MTDANWCRKCGLVLALLVVTMAASCGGGGSAPATLSDGNAVSSGEGIGGQQPLIVTDETDLSTLPAGVQELFGDEGWNQPYIEPEAGVQGLPMPSYEELMRITRERTEQGEETVLPRGWEASDPGSKSVSWLAQGSAFYGNVSPPYGGANNVPDYNGTDTVLKGEYYQFAKTAVPTYGCNADGNNIGIRQIGGVPTAIEDTIAPFNINDLGGATIPISYVLEAISKPNYFNTGGGSGGPGTGNNSRCAIYQLYASVRSANPQLFEDVSQAATQFAEVSFRSNLTQYGKGPGQGVGPGGTSCYIGTPVAIGVRGNFWKVFNKTNNALPNGTGTRNTEILIAPSGTAQGVGSSSANFKSSGNSQTEYQPFYFGSVHICYGGAQIVGLTSTTSSCQAFKDLFTQQPGRFYLPLYGAALAKWQSDTPPGATGPWKGSLGSPVEGPIAYKSGQATTEPGKKWYAWGWYFEKGFMWYVDNDQTAFPNAPDEAHVYDYSGTNTFCQPGTYSLRNPKTFYLGPNASTFRVNVGVAGYSGDDTTYNSPVYNATLNRYQIPMTQVNPTTDRVWIAATASGYGGTPDANCQYSSYIYAWRDGTVEGPFSGAAGQSRKHQYLGAKPGALPSDNKQNIYVIRVQVRDSAGAVAYGDSIPMELGGSSSAAGGDVLVVRYDIGGGGPFNTNYNALKSDLDAIKAANPSFTYAEATWGVGGASGAAWVTNTAKTYKVVIWYVGGPNGAAPLNTYQWTAQGLADCVQIMAAPNPRPIFYLSQNMSINGAWNTEMWSNYGWSNGSLSPAVTAPGETNSTFFNKLTGGQPNTYAPLFPSGFDPVSNPSPFFWQTAMIISGSTTYGERYTGTGSSGRMPTAMNYTTTLNNTQLTVMMHPQVASPAQPATFQWGLCVPHLWTPIGMPVSWGNSAAGKECWMSCYSWSNLTFQSGTPATPTRANILQNILASLDSTIGAPPAGPPPFNSYTGPAQITQVSGVQFRQNGTFTVGNTSVTGTTYPDTTTLAGFDANVLRSTPVPASNYPVATGAGLQDALNGNDAQFAAPFYAYITDPNGNMGTTGTVQTSGDETVTFGGLLLVNNGAWTRVNPNGSSAGLAFNELNAFSGAPFSNRQQVSGYYVSTTGVLAGTTRAFYGNALADLVFDNSQGSVSFECIAHWDPSLLVNGNPAQVQWRVHPADGVVDANSGGLYGVGANTTANYWREVDVDPSITPEFARTGFAYNTSDFNRTSALAGGRVLDFAFNTLRGWDGDLDRDGVRNDVLAPTEEDKFPVQCRIFSDYATYIGYTSRSFPSNVPDPTSFVEGGTYVADTGPRVLGMTLSDDGVAGNDPHIGVVTNPGPTWTVTLTYRITNCLLPLGTAPPMQYSATGVGGPWINLSVAPSAVGDVGDMSAGDGVYTRKVTVGGASGLRTFAIRGSDSGGPSNVFFWPTQVNLAPPSVLQEDFNSLSLDPGKWQPAQNLACSNLIATSAAYTNDGTGYSPWGVSPQEGAGFLRLATQEPNSTATPNHWSFLRSQTIPLASPAGNLNISFWMSGNCENFFDNVFAAVSFDGGATWSTPTFTGSSIKFWENFYAPFNAFGSPQGWTGNFSTGFPGSTAGSWVQRTNAAVPKTGTQFQFAFIYDCDIWSRPPGPAFDNLLVQ